MKLSASINLFDSSELLEPQLKQIRPVVDFVTIVYQLNSNYGDPASPYLIDVLNDLKNKGLIDKLIEYKPKTPYQISHAQYHEAKQRTLGLLEAKMARCSHFMSMDADEFYFPEELEKAKEIIKKNKCASTVCPIQDYYRFPECKIDGLQKYLVPLIYQVPTGNKSFASGGSIRNVDPTRILRGDKLYEFKPDEIIMHHMTTVRISKEALFIKFKNSTARSHYGNNPVDLTERIWSYDYKKLFSKKPPHPEVIIVPDHFNINQHFKNFKEKYKV